MIVFEFIIFVVSSGLFYSPRFRHHIWAVVIAGAVATGSSLLFFYDLYEKMQAHPEAPVKVVRQLVRVPVIQHVSQPPSLSKPENCRDEYPFFARVFDREGTTELAFTVSADGTVRDIKVRTSFVRSMGVVDATGPDNLLCYEMTGAPLPPEHGFPLQLIAPGWYGIANVKRLRGIEVRATRLENRFMGRPDRSYIRNSGAVQTKAKGALSVHCSTSHSRPNHTSHAESDANSNVLELA